MVLTLEPGLQLRGYPGFWERLSELGWIKGKTLLVYEVSARGQPDRFATLMNEVLSKNVDVIVTGSTPGALAARKATSTVPIVVISMGDPVGAGLVSSLAKPGGNLTGMSVQATDGLPGKWLELMQEAFPRLSSAAIIANPTNLVCQIQWTLLQQAAPALRLKLTLLAVKKPEDLAPALKQARGLGQAALVLADPMTLANRRAIAAAAVKYRVPTMYTMLEFADDGGLLAHGVDHAPLARRSAEYVDKILRGSNPGDLPIEQPGEFKLVINLKAGQAIGVSIPEALRLRADEVLR
jgi:putative ABC transport system substrate-binding protein